jgi:hypothetical protein
MTHIARVELDSWMVYRGRHVLELGPKAYGVSARRHSDAESSNWAGKSAFEEAIEFALSGWQNRARRHGAAGWITKGETTGGVRLVLSDGLEVHRHRAKVTKLDVRWEGRDLQGDEAQALIDARLGLSAEDRRATCFLQQREAARLVLADPAERVGIVEGWLRLERLSAARDGVQAKLRQLNEEALGALRAVALAEELLRRELGGNSEPVLSIESLEARAREARASLAMATGGVNGLEARLDLARRHEAAQTMVPEYKELVAAGRALAAEVARLDLPDLEIQHGHLASRERSSAEALNAARENARLKGVLALGQFDGHCPVAEMECPVADKINANRKHAQKLSKDALEDVAKALAHHAKHEAAERTARAALQEAQRKAERLEVMRERQRKMLPAYEAARALPEAEDAEAVGAQLDAARHAAAVARDACQALEGRLQRAKRSVMELDEARAAAAKDAPRLAALGEAAVLLGRARRLVAEGAVGEIEADANAVLRDAGIDLSFAVSWAREGKDPARVCEACGWGYPASAKVKQCGSCGAERGLNQVQRLEFELSNRSGAAEDLVGLSFQLAASRWLRTDRGCAWASASLDEPLSQMDAANRRAFGAKLGPMLKASGFTQAFVIAHSPDTIAALPGRIEIEAGPAGSTIRVAS